MKIPTLAWIKRTINSDSFRGFCTACGKTQGETEPDARGYVCRSCHEPKVYCAEELIIMGLVK